MFWKHDLHVKLDGESDGYIKNLFVLEVIVKNLFKQLNCSLKSVFSASKVQLVQISKVSPS